MSRTAARRVARQKLSTTVAAENYEFLASAARREGTSLAAVVDQVIERVRRAENRRVLEAQTEAYFDRLSAEVLREENELAAALSEAAGEIDYERG